MRLVISSDTEQDASKGNEDERGQEEPESVLGLHEAPVSTCHLDDEFIAKDSSVDAPSFCQLLTRSRASGTYARVVPTRGAMNVSPTVEVGML